MVVEYLIKPRWVIENPAFAFVLGICFAFIGTSIGWFIFPETASLAGLLFITIAATPFLEKVINTVDAETFWARNGKIAAIYGLFFLGVVACYAIWYFILPPQAITLFFDKQIAILQTPVSSIIGFFSRADFNLISVISNNLRLVVFAIVLSFIYGVGATILITWNASVLGIFLASLGKFTTMLSFAPHASLEFTAYFFAAIAGGLLSVAVNEDKTKFRSDRFYRIINDASMLFILSVLIIVAAGFIEVYAFMA
ncbi:MAG: stage II sporulation protein M [archaeon]